MNPREMLVNCFVGAAYRQMVGLAKASGFARQHYHAVRHPSDVYIGAVRVLKALMGEDWKTYDGVLLMTCATHDEVQEAERIEKQGFAYRMRKRGPNEQQNAIRAKERLEQLRIQFGPTSITDFEIDLVYTGVLWTTPEWDPALGTVVQPLFRTALKSEDWHPVPAAVAMGDLLPAAHHPEAFLAASDALFVEEWVGIDELLAPAKTQADVSPELAAKALVIMKEFDASQPGFARGRAKALAEEIGYFDQRAQDELRDRVNFIEETAVRGEWRAKSRLGLNFFEYASAMGFRHVPVA